MANVQGTNLGTAVTPLLDAAYTAMRSALQAEGVRANIVGQRCLQAIRDSLTDQVELIKELPGGASASVTATAALPEVFAEYDAAIDDGREHLDAFLKTFPVRESGVRDRAAKALKYLNTAVYEQAVLQQVKQHPELRDKVIALLGLAELSSD